VEVYQLSDVRVIHALEDARNRGVNVRVILEFAPFGDAGVSAQVTAEELRSAGLEVESGNPAFRYTHAKFLVIDRATAYILSSNLTHTGLGGTAASADRDYGVIDTDPSDTAEISALFAADWARTAAKPVAPNLVVSPDNARAKLLALIAGVQHTLSIEDEELQDGAVLAALSAASRRGVVVEVLLPAPAAAGSPVPQLGVLAQAHVAVRYGGHLYMHAKLMVVDSTRAFVGSLTLRGATAPQVLGSSPQAAPRVPEGAARAIGCFWPRCDPDGGSCHTRDRDATAQRVPSAPARRSRSRLGS
jgi:phosphatidylserine/phosphatidylglycerophosphate/cardiolipin synthase-like enzyme